VPAIPADVQLGHLEQVRKERGLSERAAKYVAGDPTRRRRRNPLGLRFRVLARDKWRCHYCGTPASETKLVIDHVHPFSKGGADDVSNYAASCAPCNGGKADVLLEVLNGD
jgi:5-methylcytosine-specific restriction endonuclease McrA